MQMAHQPNYLFLAIPNFCGSTLIHNLIATAPDVVTLPFSEPFKEDGSDKWQKDFVEGNTLAPYGYKNLHGPHSIECNMEHVYNDPSNYNWGLIAQRWHTEWNFKNVDAKIRLQKTPADVLRVKMMLPYFPNTKWIVSVRDPYAYVESLTRKATFAMEPVRQLDQICHHVTRIMELQKENKKLLGKNAYVVTYEDFCARPEYHREQLGTWLSGLEKIDFNKELNVKGTNTTNVIKDESEQRIQHMVDDKPDIFERINEFFIPKKKIIEYWGYELR
jgi:hypothetical protein